MTYTIDRIDAPSARDDLVRLWMNDLHVQGNPQDKLRWFYVEAPSGPGDAFVLRNEQGAIVGCAGIGTRTFYVRGRPVCAGVFGDFVVERSHRTALPALMLQRAARAHAKSRFTFGYAVPNESAVAIFRRNGFVELGKIVRYVRILRHEKYLQRIVDPELAFRLGPVIDGVRVVPHLVGTVAALARSRLEWLDLVDDRFDELWRAARVSYPIVGYRGTEFLRWRYLEWPAGRCDVAALVHRGSGELCGYAMIQQVSGVAYIRDFFARSEGAIGDLLALLAPALRARGCVAASVDFLGSARVVAQLEAHAFERREAGPAVFVDLEKGSSIDATEFSNVDNWYLTDGDEDN